ncbi:MAG: immunoglobulin domain-containing protein [Phycisphaerae bacterium]|nr:immunoglobulin domain-containing protein [Phycisphaerae bacterium]
MVKFKSVAVCALVAAAGQASAQQMKMAERPRPALAMPTEPRVLEDGPITICFAVGTTPGYVFLMNKLTEMHNRRFLGENDFFTFGSWSGTSATPRALTWSFVPDGVLAPGLSGQGSAASNLFATMDSGFASQGGRATWTNRFAQSFARWQALSGLSYTRVTVGGNDWDDGAAWGSGGSPGLRGDIRIAMRLLDGANNVLAFNQFPSGGGDMVLDSGDIGNFASASNSNRFLRDVVMHEHGHGMGLQHVCSLNSAQLMEPFIDTSFDGPRQDDTRGAQFLYGDDFEPNNTFGTATPLGVLGASINSVPVPNPTTGTPDTNSSIYSIEGFNQEDWYSFSVTAATVASFTITPVGSTYDNSQQAGNGSCPTTASNINTLAIGDLAVGVYASNGTTLLGQSTSGTVGNPETLSNVSLTTPGTYFMRVFCSNSSSLPQAYRFTISANSPCPAFVTHPVGNDYCDGALVALTVSVSGAPTPTLQWRKNGINIPGATGTTYAFNNATSANSGTYDCVATNSCGSATSNPAIVQVTEQPFIDTQPTNQVVALGGTATFTLVCNTPPPINFQWLQDGFPIPGANSSTLVIPNVGPEHEGSYRCLINNLCGNANSTVVTLTIGETCYPNCDGSTVAPILNVNDFTCFLNKFAANDTYANCDGSTTAPVLNVNDFTCFLNKFAAGCS